MQHLSALWCSLFCAYSLLLTMCDNVVILPSQVLKVTDEEALQVHLKRWGFCGREWENHCKTHLQAREIGGLGKG